MLSNILLAFGTPGTSTLTLTQGGAPLVFTYAVTIDPEEKQLHFNDMYTLQEALSLNGISSVIIGSALLIDKCETDGVTAVQVTGSYVTITGTGTSAYPDSMVQRQSTWRYGNSTRVRMEIRYGKDNDTFTLYKIYIDYLKAPQFIRLTQEQVDEVYDYSQILEFPDYVCQEVTNELIKLLLENGSDPRLQSHIPVNQSIANPAQEQPQQKR